MSPGGIYIHVPFCRQKCPYCSFYSVPASESQLEAYTRAVCRNLLSHRESTDIDSIYFGGGTPSLLQPAQIERILNTAAKAFSLATDTEITLECNPATVTPENLRELRRAGINRLSIGVQSFHDKQLKRLGRLHTAQEAEDTILSAAEAGFDNLSCDLMLALPEQTPEELTQTLTRMTSLPVCHVSAYLLKIEAGTPFFDSHMAKRCPDEDAAADLYLQTVSHLRAHGLFQYEVSNFARPGRESRHNCKYWKCIPYLGIGPSAHSCWHGKRFFVPSSVEEFLQAPVQPTELEDESPCSREEQILLGMRLREGVPLTWLKNKKPLLQMLEQAGYLQLTDNRVAFTAKGFLVSNAILTELL